MGRRRAPTLYNVPRATAYQMYRELTRFSFVSDPRFHRTPARGLRSDVCKQRSEEATVTVKDLEAFFDHGWNRHDVDFLMTFMSDDCVFESVAGPEVCGTRHAGRERVREAFARVFTAFPDVHFGDARHFVAGNRGASEWIFTATPATGKRIEVKGCDVFTFENAKIVLKSSYFKNRAAAR
jgi:steroid delta-isomerase-like uncharacterized protein